jgi:hypothetical protein
MLRLAGVIESKNWKGKSSIVEMILVDDVMHIIAVLSTS